MRFSTVILSGLVLLAGCYGFVAGQYQNTHSDAWLAPPPDMMSAEAAEDKKVYLATRQLEGSERWHQAMLDANLSDEETVQKFLDVGRLRLTDADRRELKRRLEKAQALARSAMSREKDIWRRRRPFIDYGGRTCVVNYKRFVTSWSYPSGHTVRGYTIALILGGMFPDKEKKLLEQAHEFAESRVICGMHWVSDVRAGEQFARKLYETIR